MKSTASIMFQDAALASSYLRTDGFVQEVDVWS
jgi:hypothetical protein